jgi:glycosyltransferase involved in cell wall biosynthesis
MKEILDIFKELHNSESGYLENQFKQIHWNKNVLYVNPQLNGRHFYKYILPYIVMYEFDGWATALTSIDKYKPNKEYELVNIPIDSKQILWADLIILPFTYFNMKDIYSKIRMINPNIKIVFNVDFNYYQISKNHPLHSIFSTADNISNIEDNIFYSDLTYVTNAKLCDVLIEKFDNELNNNKYKGIFSNVHIGTLPIFTDKDLILGNVTEELVPLPAEEKETLRIGIVATNYTWEDINSYKELFKEVKDKLGNKVKFISIGFNGIDHFTQKSCFPDGFEFEYIKPSTIVHYFKQLRNLQLDMIFVPLRVNEFNMTSENYNKLLEAGLFSVPLMVYNIYPYSELIKNGDTGILLSTKKEFVERIEFFQNNRAELKRIGENAHNYVIENFNYNEEFVSIIDEIYTLEENEG